MRRHSTITERPHCHITYKLQQQQDEAFTNGWPEQGKSSTRGRKSKKTKNRENLDAMAASVLPATNTYNDYHLKYHSVSTGSALAQSMKYAETWLYGSLSVKPTTFRPTFLNFGGGGDRNNFQGQLNLFPGGGGCFCSNHSCSNCGKQNTCNQCLIPAPSMSNYNSVQAFGTVRAKNGVHFYRENVLSACAVDPYDIIRQSRCGGAKKSATVRAKSHSPSQRKLIPLMALNRLPSPEVANNVVVVESSSRKSGVDEARKSILECDINPYDLVRSSTIDADEDDDSPLIEDRDLSMVDAPLVLNTNPKSSSSSSCPPKKQKTTLKEKIISKLQDKGRASTSSSSSRSSNNKLVDSPVNGVCIAGQKIRIFNTSMPSSVDALEDWISDPSFDDEPELEHGDADERKDAPKRPPRRKYVRSAAAKTSSNSTTAPTPTAIDSSKDRPRDTAPIYQNYEVILSSQTTKAAKTEAAPPTPTITSSSSTSHYGDIKSILKKPSNGVSSSSNGRLACEPTTSSEVSSSSDRYATILGSVVVDDRIVIDTATGITQNVAAAAGGCTGNPNSNSNNNHYRNFYPATTTTTFSDQRCGGGGTVHKKVKKQVQFKGMQEQTVDDESGCNSASKSSSSSSSSTTALAAQEREVYSSGAKTGCDDGTAAETTKTSTAAATPGTQQQLTEPLSGVRRGDEEVNVVVDRGASLDQRHCGRSRRSNVPSITLPLTALQSVAKPRVLVASSPSGFSSDSSSSSQPSVVPVLSAATDCASDPSSTNAAAQGRADVVAGEQPSSSRLHRTQSECTGPRPLLAQKHCDAFKDTMRLRLRCNPQLEPKRLFYQQQQQQQPNNERTGRSRKICSRPAIPPPLPPNVASDKSTTTTTTTTTTTGSYRAPQLPPRQYFPFEKSPVRAQEMNSAGAGKLVDSPTATKLKNGFATAGSVIKINVAPDTPPPSPQSSNHHDNRTIVTITPPQSESTTLSSNKSVADEGCDSGNNRTSITINVNDRSPPSACQSNNCNTVTINVGSDNSLTNSPASNSTTTKSTTNSNNGGYKSNVRISPQNTTNSVYVTPPPPSTQADHQQQKIASRKYVSTSSNQNENSSSGGTNTSNSNSSSSNNTTTNNNNNNNSSSSVSTDSCDNGRLVANDFSVHYMSCRINEKLTEDEVGLNQHLMENEYDLVEPIYEEISETPPPLPSEPPPKRVDDIGIVIPPRSIFEGASKYDILKYLAGAKERCRIPEEPTPEFVIEEIADSESGDSPLLPADHSRVSSSDLSSRLSHLSNVSDSSDELASFLICSGLNNASSLEKTYRNCTDIERNDSGVGSETSKCSRSKWQHVQTSSLQEDQQHICEDCEQPVETQTSDSGLTYAPLVCRKCSKKRIERREIMAEIVETEEKYGRDLRIILDEFYKPMLVAGLLTPDQLLSIFLNVEELLEHNTTLAEKLRDGYEIAIEQGDEDLLTFNIGKIFLEAAPMLHAFESYCTRQGNAALLLANLEKEKELLKIFLRVSQMENTVLRRMNLNSFLMVPVQRVTKYPLLLARLYKVTPEHHTVQRELLKEAQHNIELHLEHINSLTKDIGSMKIWRRISMMNGRRVSSDVDDIVNIKLQKIAVEVLEWGHEEVRFVMESRLLYAQPTDHNWKRTGRTIKVIPVNALLVTLGKPTENYNPECEDRLTFPQKNGIREASLLLMKEKGGKYSLVRDPLFLDHCIIYCDSDYEEYFEVQEIPTKDTYIFKAEDEERTRQWYKQLQYHSQGLGCWRKRRNALANIMINGMQVRS